MNDRFGVGFRSALAGSVLAHLGELDVLEVMADSVDVKDAPAMRAMARLARERPVVLHGVSLGLCSASEVSRGRLERLARLVEVVAPESWSEHLAFVRVPGIELGHLTAPPRTQATLDGLAHNVERAREVIGSLPLLENVATMFVPPGPLNEPDFVRAALERTDTMLLLDLHNLYANAFNRGEEPRSALAQYPLERVRMVHLAGGREVVSADGKVRLLDDHLHETPAAVFELLEELGARTKRPLTVILERDGAFPAFDVLLRELGRARAALRRGRTRAAS